MRPAATGYRRGLTAESWAAVYFICKGYRPLARRYRTAVGEIDLVLRRGRRIVFVEVKLRAAGADTASESISPASRDRIRRAALLYLQRHPAYSGFDIRFDVLLMTDWRWPRHIENAF